MFCCVCISLEKQEKRKVLRGSYNLSTTGTVHRRMSLKQAGTDGWFRSIAS